MAGKKEKIQIDKDFLDKVLKSNADTKKVSEDLIKAFDEINEKLIEIQENSKELSPVISEKEPDDDIAFFCNTVSCVSKSKIPTIQEIAMKKIQEQAFSVDLKKIMIKHKIVQVSASLLKNLI